MAKFLGVHTDPHLHPCYVDDRRAQYLETANEQMLVIMQTEHVEAVRNMEWIFAIPGIDAVHIGPVDLSASMGLLGQCEHPAVLETIKQIREAAERAGVAPGIPVWTPAQANARIKEGFRFVQLGTDTYYLSRCRDALHRVHRSAGTSA